MPGLMDRFVPRDDEATVTARSAATRQSMPPQTSSHLERRLDAYQPLTNWVGNSLVMKYHNVSICQ